MDGLRKTLSHGSAVIQSGDREDLFQSSVADKLAQIICNGCHQEFSNHQNWEEHITTEGGDDNHGDIFQEMYVSTGEVLGEEAFMEREFNCTDCGRFFEEEEEKDEHRGTVSTSVRLVCPQCGEHAGDMEKHLVQHTGDVQCGECNDFFGDINVHIENIHSGYSAILTTLHTRCAGDGTTLGWREVSLSTNARFLASEVKPAGDATIETGLIVDYIQVPSSAEEGNDPGGTGTVSSKKLQSRLLYNENRQKALMPPDQLPDRFFGVNGERLWSKFPPGAHICELCGFKAITKNKYREKQDHYAKWHFKERLEGLLPQVRPYLCPDFPSGCDYSGKDKQTVMRHYTGKHNIFELWVSEFINDIKNPLVCREDLVQVHRIENVDLEAKRSSSICTVRFTNGSLKRVPLNSVRGIAPPDTSTRKATPNQVNLLKRPPGGDDDGRATRIRCSFCPDLQVFDSEVAWKTHCSLKHGVSNDASQQVTVSPRKIKSPVADISVKCPGCLETFTCDDTLKVHWPDCEGTPESILGDVKPMTSIPVDALVDIENTPEMPPKKKLKRPPPALIPIDKMAEMGNNNSIKHEDITVKVEPDDICDTTEEIQSELIITNVCSMNQVLEVAQVSPSSMLCLTCPQMSDPLTSFSELSSHILSSHYDMITKRKFIIVKDKFKTLNSPQSYLCSVCGKQYATFEKDSCVEQHSQKPCDPLSLVFKGFTQKASYKKPYMPSTAQVTAVPLEKRRRTDLVVVSKEEVPKEVVENYEKNIESTSQEFKIKKGGPTIRFPCSCNNCKDPNYFGKEHCCNIPGCDKTFSKTAHLRAHLRGHNNERPYPCSWPGCGRRFVRSDELRRHAWIHTKADRFKCETCGKGYSRADHFRVHVARCHLEGGSNINNNPLESYPLIHSPESMGELIYI